MATQLVKVHFTLDPKDWHGTGGEFLWASPTGGSVGDEFELENSPFLVKCVSYKDVVKAMPSGDARTYEFQSVIRRAGHSTYRLLVEPDSPKFQEYWKLLEEQGCTYESGPIKMNIGPRDHYSSRVSCGARCVQMKRTDLHCPVNIASRSSLPGPSPRMSISLLLWVVSNAQRTPGPFRCVE